MRRRIDVNTTSFWCCMPAGKYRCPAFDFASSDHVLYTVWTAFIHVSAGQSRSFWAATWENVPSYVCPTQIQIRLHIRIVRFGLRCSHEETLHPWLSKMRTAKIQIRLRECAGWSESSQGAHVKRYIFWNGGFLRYSLFMLYSYTIIF